ncbi:hypothetical protein M3Y98_01218900 [Aphelenchoides besseyi]|nr:hypothetical protein M3Y98_01218900 [Aphelenchoides besseyi]
MESKTKSEVRGFFSNWTNKRRAICGLSPHVSIRKTKQALGNYHYDINLGWHVTYLCETVLRAFFWGFGFEESFIVLLYCFHRFRNRIASRRLGEKTDWYFFFLEIASFRVYWTLIFSLHYSVTAVYLNLINQMPADQNLKLFIYMTLNILAAIWNAYSWIVAKRSKNKTPIQKYRRYAFSAFRNRGNRSERSLLSTRIEDARSNRRLQKTIGRSFFIFCPSGNDDKRACETQSEDNRRRSDFRSKFARGKRILQNKNIQVVFSDGEITCCLFLRCNETTGRDLLASAFVVVVAQFAQRANILFISRLQFLLIVCSTTLMKCDCELNIQYWMFALMALIIIASWIINRTINRRTHAINRGFDPPSTDIVGVPDTDINEKIRTETAAEALQVTNAIDNMQMEIDPTQPIEPIIAAEFSMAVDNPEVS